MICNTHSVDGGVDVQVAVTLTVRRTAGTLALELGSMSMLRRRSGSLTTECTLTSRKRLELFHNAN